MNAFQNNEINVGIDTAQARLDFSVRPTGEYFSYPNTPKEALAAAKRLSSLNPTRVLIEATGRLESNFVNAARKIGLPLVICNPSQVRNFAKASGRVAKTDKLDAGDIAHFGEALKPRLTLPQVCEIPGDQRSHRCAQSMLEHKHHAKESLNQDAQKRAWPDQAHSQNHSG